MGNGRDMNHNGNGAGFLAMDDRLDRLINLDIGQRGMEPLYQASRGLTGRPLVGAAAEALLGVPRGGCVLMTTGSVSRAWLSPAIGENDGPSGAATIARALVLSRRASVICALEEALVEPVGAVMQAAGLSVVDFHVARQASTEGGLATVVMAAYPDGIDAARRAAGDWLDHYQPDLLFAVERVGRNRNGIYYNMAGRDYSMGRARIDHLFDEGLARGIPVIAVGDGGNEIGMGKIAEAVAAHIPYGAAGDCPCGGGIGAVTGADIVVTAGVSNWACTAIAAAMAARTNDPRLFHTARAERRLLHAMTTHGLINATHGVVDSNVDGISEDTHAAVAQIACAIAGHTNDG